MRRKCRLFAAIMAIGLVQSASASLANREYCQNQPKAPGCLSARSHQKPAVMDKIRQQIVQTDDYDVELVDTKLEQLPPAPPPKSGKWSQSLASTFNQLEAEAAGTFSHKTPKKSHPYVPAKKPVERPQMAEHAIPVPAAPAAPQPDDDFAPPIEPAAFGSEPGPAPAVTTTHSRVDTVGQKSKVVVILNQSSTVHIPPHIKHIFVTNPEMVQTQRQGHSTLALYAKKMGETELFFMNNEDQVAAKYTVSVEYDIEKVRRFVRRTFPAVEVSSSPNQQGIILSGDIDSEKTIRDIRNSVRRFVGDEQRVISQLTVRQLNVRPLSVRQPERKGARVRVSRDGRHLIINNVTPQMVRRMARQYPWLAELPVFQTVLKSSDYQKKHLVVDISASLVQSEVEHRREIVVNF